MTSTEVRDRVKERMDIASSVTTFDTLIDHSIEDAVTRLSPYFRVEALTTGTLTAETNTITVSETADAHVTKLWLMLDGENYQAYNGWRVHGSTLHLDDKWDEAVEYRYLVRTAHTYANINLVPDIALPALFLFAMAEFATTLVGNKRKFNIYQQNNGARSLDEFKDLVEWYEVRAIRICQDAQESEGA